MYYRFSEMTVHNGASQLTIHKKSQDSKFIALLRKMEKDQLKAVNNRKGQLRELHDALMKAGPSGNGGEEVNPSN